MKVQFLCLGTRVLTSQPQLNMSHRLNRSVKPDEGAEVDRSRHSCVLDISIAD